MKAFIGIVLYTIAGKAQVLLIDEPEAFLHPAQARALGRWLATEARERDKQVLVATHDRDFVLGLLDSSAPVKMVRVSRADTATHLHELSEERLEKVWADPVLRYSNILQGLFHEHVVVAEADADCRFFAAVLDILASEGSGRAIADSTLFVPSGGKQRAPVLAEALSSLGVIAYSLVDFDVLRERQDVRSLLEALGGAWDDAIESLYSVVIQPLNKPGGWDVAKKQGLDALPAGAAYNAGAELLARLREQRLLVIPVGEMEDFDKSIAAKGSAWVSAMLERGGHKSSSAAREFVRPLAEAST